jgi:hypothetical protein
MAWRVRIDDLGVHGENAERLAARMNDQEKSLPADERRKWEIVRPYGVSFHAQNPFLYQYFYNSTV